MYQVGRFDFESKEDAKRAKKEADGIRYIRNQTNLEDPDVVLKLYRRFIEQGLFETPVGMQFLSELQAYLQTIPYIKSEDIPMIPVKPTPEKEKPDPYAFSDPKHYQMKFRAMLLISGVLAVMIIGMFVITIFAGKNASILNYENEIIDKYEAWEQELNEREEQLEMWEELLKDLQGELQGQ